LGIFLTTIKTGIKRGGHVAHKADMRNMYKVMVRIP